MSGLFERTHVAAGCYDCQWANTEALGKGPACTYMGRIVVTEKGRCSQAGDVEKTQERRGLMVKVMVKDLLNVYKATATRAQFARAAWEKWGGSLEDWRWVWDLIDFTIARES